ncbi:MAG TPA: VanW family protein, partial [Pyrinomonadaceae bacterium]|nr:VanW family protein [Pyrinomonadaceae bacterium]
MTATPEIPRIKKLPTRAGAFVFRGKAVLLQARRSITDMLDPNIERHPAAVSLENAAILASSSTALWTDADPRERFLIAGKIHNLRLVAAKLNGIEVPAGKTFSFWKQIGRTSRMRGFAAGRELREGCIVPSIGGGLCQASNALYDAAVQAGFEIVERHAHTQVIPGSLAEKDRDATVFWNYVDLQFRSETPFRIESVLDGENLILRFRGEKAGGKVPVLKRAVIHSS